MIKKMRKTSSLSTDSCCCELFFFLNTSNVSSRCKSGCKACAKNYICPQGHPLTFRLFSNSLELIFLLITISINSRPNGWSVDRLLSLITLSFPLIILGITQNTLSNKYCSKCNWMFLSGFEDNSDGTNRTQCQQKSCWFCHGWCHRRI